MTSPWRKLALHSGDLDASGHDTTGGFTNPMTTAADLIVGGTAGAPARLAKGSDGQVLTVDPTTHLLIWATPAGGASFATPAIVLGTAAAAGAASTVIRSDSTIAAFDATVPVTQAFSDSAATGSVAFAARRDHKHGMPASPGGGGALVFLEAHTASASSSLDFTTFISSTYDTYVFKFVSIIPATSTSILWMRMGTGGGPTYDAGTAYGTQLFRHSFNASAISGADSGANQIVLTTAWLSTGVHPITGSLELYDPQSAALHKFVSGKFVYPDSTLSNMAVSEMGGEYNSTTAVTAVRFLMSSGNITSGTIRVYGMTKS